MKTLLTPNTPVKKVALLAIALAIVVGMSYLGSDEYLHQSIMEMLMGGTANGCNADCDGYCCPGRDSETNECYCEGEDLDECSCSAGEDCSCAAFCPHEHHHYDWCVAGGGRDNVFSCPADDD